MRASSRVAGQERREIKEAELEKHKHEICGMKKPTEEGEGGSEGDDKENGGGDAMVE